MLEQKIESYIRYMRKKYNICGAMVTGSYITGKMGPHSDIDIFFIWNDDTKSMRGREYFLDTEFEYFISPEWKYIDRLNNDCASMRIYSSARILYDEYGKLSKIQLYALEKVNNYESMINNPQRMDLKFFIETIFNDGIDMYDKKDYSNFLFFTYSNLQKLCDIVCKLNNKLPVYSKYGISEIGGIDSSFGILLEKYLITDYLDINKKNLWIELCDYGQEILGNFDITNYESVQIIK
jgi:predicted nucleotidyltransferase